MAFMRGENYVFITDMQNGKKKTIPAIVFSCPKLDGWLDVETFDELVIMRYLQLKKDKKLESVEKRALKKWHGNTGCDELSKKYKRPGVIDIVKSLIKEGLKEEKNERR